MKKKIILGLFIIVGLFLITGCSKITTTNNTSKETEAKEIVTFTKLIEKSHVKYRAPESISDMGGFKDQGKSCYIYYYTNQSSVYALYPYDDQVEKVNKVTINGFNYETYKYKENSIVHYVYRTKVNNDYHLFQYDVYASEYDDKQVEAFMNTVEYVYDEITYKQP